jgi:hypothetical protein
MDESADALRARCVAEIDTLHRVIGDWLTGRSERSATVFAAFADAHVAGFTMVTPDGSLVRRDEVLGGFEGAHGTAAALSIQIVDVEVVHADVRSVVATYEEWQDGPGGRNGRRSTVLLDRDAAAPHGLRSRHLHETWIARG